MRWKTGAALTLTLLLSAPAFAGPSDICSTSEFALKGDTMFPPNHKNGQREEREVRYKGVLSSSCKIKVLVWLTGYLFDKDGNDMGQHNYRTDVGSYGHRPIKLTIMNIDDSVTRADLRITRVEVYPGF